MFSFCNVQLGGWFAFETAQHIAIKRLTSNRCDFRKLWPRFCVSACSATHLQLRKTMSFIAKTSIAALLFVFALSSVGWAETTHVQLKNGKTLVGKVNKRSDANTLWLEFKGANTKVLRPISRTAIAAMFQVEVVSTQPVAVAGQTDAQRVIRLISDGDHEDARSE